MVHWSFLHVPLERRLQTAAVLLWFVTSPLGGIPFFLFICFFCTLVFPLLLPVLIIYILWVIFKDKAPTQGGRPWKKFRNSKIWKYFANYFPVQLKKTVDLDPQKNYLFCYHPHGVLSIGAVCNFASNATGFDQKFPGIDVRIGTLDLNFLVPVYREWLLACGLVSVSYASCIYNLTKRGPGASLLIVTGGAKESLDAHPGKSTLTLQNRKGFVRVALKTGAALVPVFSFGENDLWDQLENPEGSTVRKWQNKIEGIVGFALPLLRGRGVFNYDFGLLPFRNKVVSVVGKPLQCPKIEGEVDKNLLDIWHQKYLDSLKELYDEYKDVYYKDRIEDLVFK